MQYNAVYLTSQVILGKGDAAIITGWTVSSTVKKRLDPSEYAVIGQLYSPTRGINFLARNLIANPQIRHLIVLNATKEDDNAGGCRCLVDFFKHGFEEGKTDTGKKCWVIKSEVKGYIDIEVSKSALLGLKTSVTVKEATSISELLDYVKYVKEVKKPLKPWGKPQEFPLAVFEPSILPGRRYGHCIEGKTVAETWVKIIQRIKTTGIIRPNSYGGKWQELIDLMSIVTDEPEGFYFPEPNFLPIDRKFIKEYVHQILDDAPYKEGVKYTYGNRLRSWFGRNQIRDVIQKLTREPDAASAVMNLWDSGSGNQAWANEPDSTCNNAIKRYGRNFGDSDHQHGGSPCLNHIWVRIVDNELSLTATFRSNDMFSAWPANAMGLRALQKHILDEINKNSTHSLKLGPLITMSQSAHIYDNCWEYADKLVQQQYKLIKNFSDPVGNFLIEIDEGVIKVTQTTPGNGEAVKTFKGKNPLKILEEIYQSSPGIEAIHCGYLGIELQKAYERLKKNKTYTQDR